MSQASELAESLANTVGATVIGQAKSVRALTVALLAGGHVLLEGAPGTAKTLLANCFAHALGLDFKRVQCTPDMLPADITGTVILEGSEFKFRPGPVFANIVLADEINRTPPKTQSALLEAMQENQVSVGGTSYQLPDPFMVVATENPIEYEGTYQLPEAQLDRFLMKVVVDYPSEDEEIAIVEATTSIGKIGFAPNSGGIDRGLLATAKASIPTIHVSPDVAKYVSSIIRATRTQPSVQLGTSPRSAAHLITAARVSAALDDRDFVTPDDVSSLAALVLGHRVILNAESAFDGMTNEKVIANVLAQVAVPR